MENTETNLFRSVRKLDFPAGVIIDDHAVVGVLYPSFKDSTYQTNVRGKLELRTRRADIYPYTHEGQEVVDPGGGTSLFDKENTFGTKHWWYFRIPEGTVIPDSLQILDTGYNEIYSAEHYQIEPATLRLPVEAFKGALDNLARNAIEKLYKDAR
jgi:hypothetical protein